MTLAEFAIASTALTYLMGQAKITKPLRDRLPLRARLWMSCEACAGTWNGVGLALASASPWPRTPTGILLAGAAGMTLSAIGISLMRLGIVEPDGGA